MPYRTTPFVNQHFYHVYNRGSEKRRIFEDRRDYQRFLKTLTYYQLEGPKPKLSHFFKYKNFNPLKAKKIVDILAYCLMSNHFHLLLKQVKEGGISEMITKLSLSYTKYYNTKYDRVGPLFQGQFKAVLIESDEQLLHVSRYIHLNPIVSLLTKSLDKFDWSSSHEYFNRNDGICSKKDILSFFPSPRDYQQFVLDQVDYGKHLEEIKHKLFDKDLA
ncbi:transposase [Candidatus Daviesbacteria bacterium]|nr:transposase [Candidatus Daviesbacteria bacterium]